MSDNSGLIADALLKTDPYLWAQIDGGNSWRMGIKKRGARVKKYRNYERGEHDSGLTNQMRKMLRLAVDDAEFNDFNINYCRIIVDKMLSRLRVLEIRSEGKDTTQDAWINDLLIENDFKAIQSTFFHSAIRDGDSFAMVDPETLKWTSEPAYDGFSGIVAILKRNDYPVWACKLWSESDNQDLAGEDTSMAVMKLLVYQPNRITQWKGQVDTNVVEADPTQAEIPWPLDIVPLVHFSNLTDNYTLYGESELRVAIPIQNVQNRTLHSMVMASEFSAFKVAWSIGMSLDKSGITPGAVLNMVLQDAHGADIVEMTSEQIEFLKAVRVGEFSATDISQYTNQLAEITKHISQISQTPIYGVTAQGNLSGEALKQLEVGLVGKAQRFQNENDSAVKLLIDLTAKIQDTFDTGLGSPPELERLHVQWMSPEILNVTEAITTMLTIREKAPGLFADDFIRSRIGSLLDLDQSQIQEEADKANNQSQQTLDALTGANGTPTSPNNQPFTDTGTVAA